MKWLFWKWLIIGLSDRPGYCQLLNWWLLVHVAAGVAVNMLVKVPIHEAAQTFLLPLAGIFIGLSFAWVGNAQALLQESEIERIAQHHPDGIQTYIYTFQLAILIILITLVAWGLAGLKVFNFDVCDSSTFSFVVGSFLYFLASLTLRECWHIVIGSQLLILSRHNVRTDRNDSA